MALVTTQETRCPCGSKLAYDAADMTWSCPQCAAHIAKQKAFLQNRLKKEHKVVKLICPHCDLSAEYLISRDNFPASGLHKIEPVKPQKDRLDTLMEDYSFPRK